MLYRLTGTALTSTDVEGLGGHFAVLEEPELVVADISEFFRELR